MFPPCPLSWWLPSFFDLLFTTVSRTLLTLGEDEKRLGGTLGVTAVLHTWTRELKST